MTSLIEGKKYLSTKLLKSLPLTRHFYIFPFLFYYPSLLFLIPLPYNSNTFQLSTEYKYLIMGISLVLNVLCFLLSQWFIGVRRWMCYQTVYGVEEATDLFLVLKDGKHLIVPIYRNSSSGKSSSGTGGGVWCEVYKKKYIYSREEKKFMKLRYPISLPIRQYFLPPTQTTQTTTTTTQATNTTTSQQYGKNELYIPIPTFWSLFKDHALAPFFVFQVFSVLLWILDEYWYYSLFTLMMLCVFESTVVGQRLRNLKELRQMSSRGEFVYIYSGGGSKSGSGSGSSSKGKWVKRECSQIKPGDWIKIEKGECCCDLLIIRGKCIVNEALLTGESTPTFKESVPVDLRAGVLDMKDGVYKSYLLYAGTKVLSVEGEGDSEGGGEGGSSSEGGEGVVGYVLRTGFATTQGKLVRLMYFNTTHVSIHSKESIYFLLFLLFFAICSSYYVYQQGVKHNRNPYKLYLDICMILTSVVPPELPMELSLAVNQSLLQLSRKYIFCTEPFRIPIAGGVDILCFDKTGTLTCEKIDLRGVLYCSGQGQSVSKGRGSSQSSSQSGRSGSGQSGSGQSSSELKSPGECEEMTYLVVGGCHSVVEMDGKQLGDPLELEILQKFHFSFIKQTTSTTTNKSNTTTNNNTTKDNRETLVIQKEKHMKLRILKKYGFTSQLKRMSTIVDYQGKYFGLVKGAPEYLKPMFRQVPDDYDILYKLYARRGNRILALGYKPIPTTPTQNITQTTIMNMEREDVESELLFAGFVVLHCPIKDDSLRCMRELIRSGHKVCMITGDQPLTAIHVARELRMITGECLLVSPATAAGGTVGGTGSSGSIGGDSGGVEFVLEDQVILRLTMNQIHNGLTQSQRQQIDGYEFCLSGQTLDLLQHTKLYTQYLLLKTWIYARTSPTQKEDIIHSYKQLGFSVLMCGDGTNDVGALKKADVGVALLSCSKEELQEIERRGRERVMKEMKERQEELMKRFGVTPPPTTTNTGTTGNASANTVMNERANKMMEQLAMEEPPVLKFGDASVAASFTSKIGSIQSIVEIIKYGRCTLVTTNQMYKILALNSLINAYSLSVLYLEGIKYGDVQLTIQSFLVAGCFMFLSFGRVGEGELGRERVRKGVLGVYCLGSVFGQFLVHSYVLWRVYSECLTYSGGGLGEAVGLDERLSGERKFVPTVMNSGVYLISLAQQGRPFRESLKENKPLYYTLLGLFSLSLLGALQLFPEVNRYVELIELSPQMSEFLVWMMLGDVFGCWLIEAGFRFVFGYGKVDERLVVGGERVVRGRVKVE